METGFALHSVPDLALNPSSASTSTTVSQNACQDYPPVRPPVKIALFGVGRWGTHWLRHLLDHPQAELVAVIDACEQRLNTLARQYQLAPQVKLTTDWRMALELANLEAVVMVTPAAMHYEMIRTALGHGHHVLAEKPLTLNPSEAFELCQLAVLQQRQLVVDHTYLFHPAVQQGRVLVPELGDLRYGYAARTHLGPVRQDVDALWDLAIHDIAIFNHWLNAMPIQVQAQGIGWLQPGLSDLVWVKLTYASGFEATIHLCWSNPDKQRRLSLVGSQGTIVFDEMAASPLSLLRGSLQPQQTGFMPCDQHHQAIDLEPTEPLRAVCTHFLDAVQQNRESELSSGWLGANLVNVLAALTQSLQQKGQPMQVLGITSYDVAMLRAVG
jgi:predicted dehydrogenase